MLLFRSCQRKIISCTTTICECNLKSQINNTISLTELDFVAVPVVHGIANFTMVVNLQKSFGCFSLLPSPGFPYVFVRQSDLKLENLKKIIILYENNIR